MQTVDWPKSSFYKLHTMYIMLSKIHANEKMSQRIEGGIFQKHPSQPRWPLSGPSLLKGSTSKSGLIQTETSLEVGTLLDPIQSSCLDNAKKKDGRFGLFGK